MSVAPNGGSPAGGASAGLADARLDDPELRRAAVRAVLKESSLFGRYPEAAMDARPCRKWALAQTKFGLPVWRPAAGGGPEDATRRARLWRSQAASGLGGPSKLAGSALKDPAFATADGESVHFIRGATRRRRRRRGGQSKAAGDNRVDDSDDSSADEQAECPQQPKTEGDALQEPKADSPGAKDEDAMLAVKSQAMKGEQGDGSMDASMDAFPISDEEDAKACLGIAKLEAEKEDMLAAKSQFMKGEPGDDSIEASGSYVPISDEKDAKACPGIAKLEAEEEDLLAVKRQVMKGEPGIDSMDASESHMPFSHGEDAKACLGFAKLEAEEEDLLAVKRQVLKGEPSDHCLHASKSHAPISDGEDAKACFGVAKLEAEEEDLLAVKRQVMKGEPGDDSMDASESRMPLSDGEDAKAGLGFAKLEAEELAFERQVLKGEPGDDSMEASWSHVPISDGEDAKACLGIAKLEAEKEDQLAVTSQVVEREREDGKACLRVAKPEAAKEDKDVIMLSDGSDEEALPAQRCGTKREIGAMTPKAELESSMAPSMSPKLPQGSSAAEARTRLMKALFSSQSLVGSSRIPRTPPCARSFAAALDGEGAPWSGEKIALPAEAVAEAAVPSRRPARAGDASVDVIMDDGDSHAAAK